MQGPAFDDPDTLQPETGLMLKPEPAPLAPGVERMDVEDPQARQPLNTLDESVSDTLVRSSACWLLTPSQLRDLKMVANKLRFVAFPYGGGIQQLGRDCEYGVCGRTHVAFRGSLGSFDPVLIPLDVSQRIPGG